MYPRRVSSLLKLCAKYLNVLIAFCTLCLVFDADRCPRMRSVMGVKRKSTYIPILFVV